MYKLDKIEIFVPDKDEYRFFDVRKFTPEMLGDVADYVNKMPASEESLSIAQSTIAGLDVINLAKDLSKKYSKDLRKIAKGLDGTLIDKKERAEYYKSVFGLVEMFIDKRKVYKFVNSTYVETDEAKELSEQMNDLDSGLWRSQEVSYFCDCFDFLLKRI